MSNGNLPPMTAAQLRTRLQQDGQTRSYVYIGPDDGGWAVALNRQQVLPALDVYRADNHTLLEGEWPEATEDVAALVFGYTDQVKATLTRQETGDRFGVRDAIVAASGGDQ